MRKKIFTFLLALAASVGMMNAAVDGKLSGAFTVNAGGDQVYFSQGNLQYQASTNTWRFAEHQYDFIGDAAGNNTESGRNTQSDWIDLFGWATSGNSASGTAYQPWQSSTTDSEYGPAITSGQWTYANSDWGINPISNGGNVANSWRTLTQAEWDYILNGRATTYRFCYAKLTIGYGLGYGLIILPDDWDPSYYALSAGSMNQGNHSYDSNVISEEDWTNSLEAHGAVFLPVTGMRYNGNAVIGLDDDKIGLYWSSIAAERHEVIENPEEDPMNIDIVNAAYNLAFNGGYYIRANQVTTRSRGLAVRLVYTEPSGDPTPTPSGDEGKLLGAFTINSNGDQIVFSKGNLQYHCTNHVWQFATNQYDIIGGDNANISDSYDGWIDLFGYGTGNNPTLVSTSYGDYSTFTDWGVNAISNGGNEANLWRTLTSTEWLYMFRLRPEAHNKYGAATVANVPGIIVLPDVYVGPAINTVRDAWDNNVISSSEWAAYEAAGAVFLPAAGYRSGTTMYNVGSEGFCWSSTPDPGDAEYSYKLCLSPISVIEPQGFGRRNEGISVRLVKAASAQDIADVVIALINDIPNPVAYNDECKDAIDAARAAYDALTDAQKDLVENYGDLLDAETAYAQSIPHPNGECGAQGNNLLWDLDPSTGVLTITGSGAMNDWPDDTQRPWYDNRLQITSVVLPSGITSIGEKAFRGCNNLASINMTENYPAGLTAINQEAFCNTKLTSVTIPESVVTIGMDAFYLSQAITDVYCYADPNNLTWNDYYRDDFKKTPAKSTQCHVKDCHLDVFNTNWNTGNTTDVNVTFVGDLPGDCGGSTPAVDPAVQNVIDLINAIPNPVAYNDECKDAIDVARAAYDALDADQKALVSNYSTLTDAEDAYAALIPVVTNYSISLDGITENADKVTLNNASAAEGETITLTPAAGYQITAFTASYASAYSVRVTADPNVNVYDATPYVGALPKEFTENVTPGLNGATFHSIEGDDPFTPVPASVLEYVGMNAAKDQMTIRVNDAFSGIIRVNYTYNVENCEWDEYEQQEICMGGTALASVRVVCEAAGGVAPASKDDVTGAYSFTMPAGNVTITATVEPVTPAGPTADMSKNIAIDLRGQQLGGTSSEGGSKYLIIDSENNYTYVDDEPAAYNAHFAFDNFNGTQHGYTNLLVTAPVTAGQYLLTLGGCQFGTGTGNVKNASSEILAEFDQKTAACYDANPAKNIVSKIFTVDAAQTITIDCGNWTPYIALKKMPEIPAFTDFTINFMSDSYTVAEGTLPAGTVIDGTPNTGQTAHGYQNVVATVPVKAGKYRLTLGTCQYGTGTGNVMSETNIELASFDQKTAACYHQNPAENIISMIFDVDQDQHITIDCGNYTPYMKLEAVTSYAVEFALGDAEGTAPAAVDVTIGEDITMPVNKTMYKAGYTLTGWSDGVNTYPIGESFTPDNDVVLTPVFTANEADLLNASTDVSVKWYFGGDNGAPDMHLEGSAGLLVAQATIGDKTVDVKLGIDATSGKFVPQPTTEWAQVRVGTIFTYPYKEGMTVDVHTYSGNVTYYIADGNVTCGTNDYYSYIELTFPAPASTAVVIGDPNDATEVENFLTTYDGQTIDELIIDRPVYNNMYNTLCLPFDMNATQIAASSLNGVEIREFTGASVEGTTLNLSVGDPVNAVVAGRPYFVKYSAASQLEDLHFEDVTINNALLDNMAVTFDGVTFKGTFTPFVMPNGLNFQGGYLFLGQNNQLFWPNTDHPLKPFRAYFYVNVESSTPGNAPKYRGMPARIVEGKNVATGVENAQSANQSTKVIVNGQLIIIKNDVRYNAQGQIVK